MVTQYRVTMPTNPRKGKPMAITTKSVEVATCDSCGATRAASGDGTKPLGVHGTVKHVTKDGVTELRDWFACKLPHIGKAIRAVLDGADMADGESEHQSDGEADGEADGKADGKP